MDDYTRFRAIIDLVEFQRFEPKDYDDVMKFWRSVEHMGLSGADSRENISSYLDRNPGLSTILRDGGKVIGSVLCGHDGRRGFLHHLAVAHEYRGRGLGKELVRRSIGKLGEAGIMKCHIFVFRENRSGMSFR